ncbi:MAG: caspase family protein [Pseudomonadota bacterium]
MSDKFSLNRRQALIATGIPAALSLASTMVPNMAWAVQTDTVTVLYRRDSTSAVGRLEPAAQAAILAMEGEFAKRGFRVLQPSPGTYVQLDQGPAVAVSFAPDAGFSMLFSAYRSMRPMPGMDKALTEVILRCRVFVGHTILMAEESRGMMASATEAEVREFAERRSAELAAQRAVALLADKVANRLKALSPVEIDRLSQLVSSPPPQFSSVPVPAEAAAPVAPAAAAGQPLPQPARKFALIVAMSDYSEVGRRMGSQIKSLPGVAQDRRNMVDGLKAQGFPAENIKILADSNATSASVRDELGKLVAKTQPDDLVLIAISAHGVPGDGVPSGFGMPILNDYTKDHPGALDFWQLQSMVGNLPCRQAVLVVDTCHSGSVTKMMVNAVVSANGVSVSQQSTVTPDPSRMMEAQGSSGRAFAVISAAKADELSLEDGTNGGLFTSTLMRALQANKGQKTLAQVFKDQVEQQVIDASKPRCPSLGCKVQTPLFAYSGRGDQIKI